LPRSVVSLPFTVFIYYGYNARAIELVDLISVALSKDRQAWTAVGAERCARKRKCIDNIVNKVAT